VEGEALERLLMLAVNGSGSYRELRDLQASVQGEMERRGSANAQRIWRAMMVAPTLEICMALLEGQAVPQERLDPVWLERFGLKHESNEEAQ
jgi:hypothetical protein